MLSLLAKSAIYRSNQQFQHSAVSLPLVKRNQTHAINVRHCERYHKLVNWHSGIASLVHPNYIQVLSLPMQVSMMVQDPFPFKPIGLVHISNDILVHRLCEQQDKLMLETRFGALMWHKKGWVFEMITDAYVGSELRISATSCYLARVKHDKQANDDSVKTYKDEKPELQDADLSLEPNYKLLYQSFEFEKNIGRKYASVSKDFNPIHLSALSAKLLGFKKAIAHGMYSKALCVSSLFKKVPELRQALLGSFRIYTEFMQPIYLPTKNTLVANKPMDETVSDRSTSFRLGNFARGKTKDYLRGEINVLDKAL